MNPVDCVNGHHNDPYPENGLCVVCGKWLPGNKNRFDSEKSGEMFTSKTAMQKNLRQKARDLIEGVELDPDDVPKHIQMMAETAAKSKNMKDMEFFLQQVGQLTAKPKAAEEVEATVIEVVVSDALLESLEVLSGISRDRSRDL